VGGAVVRNRARRLLRETFRRHRRDLARPVDLVLVARPPIVSRDLAGIEHDFLKALRQAHVLKPQAQA
jgi:ribonuclease P protein component